MGTHANQRGTKLPLLKICIRCMISFTKLIFGENVSVKVQVIGPNLTKWSFPPTKYPLYCCKVHYKTDTT